MAAATAAAAAAAAAAIQQQQHPGGNGTGGGCSGGGSLGHVPPPHAHAKSTPTGATSWGTPSAATVYRQHQPSANTPLGSSPGVILQQHPHQQQPLQQPQPDIYAQGDMYRRSAVFVSQAAPYQTAYNRVVPPPAHNASSRQVLPTQPLPAHIQFPTAQYGQFGPLSPAQIANKHHYTWFGE